MKRCFFAALAVTMASVLAPAQARAEALAPPHEFAWNPAWKRFRPAECVATGVLGGAALAALLVLKPRESPHWTGGILLDDTARDGLRLRSKTARDTARHLSDWTALSMIFALSVDSVLVPAARGSSDVALQLTLMDLEAFAASTLIVTGTMKSVGRARPSYADCVANPNFDPLCNTGPTASFPSGHASTAFTAAGLSCAHHSRAALYGDALADTLACGLSVFLAVSTATLRVAGDRHYLSDVSVGGAIGFGVGYATPVLLHYAGSNSVRISAGSEASNYGLTFSGAF